MEDSQNVVGKALPGLPNQDRFTRQASAGQPVPMTAPYRDPRRFDLYVIGSRAQFFSCIS